MAEAEDILCSKFGDKVSVQKALHMLGNRKSITASDFKRLTQVIPKIMVMQ